MRCHLGLVLIVAFACSAGQLAAGEPARIQPDPQNPRYWQYKGKPIVLIGGSKDDNLFQIPDLKEHLDLLAKLGGNYIRNTMSDRRDLGHEVHPFKQLPNGKYDLNEWNEEYWTRFANLLKWTAERDIIVQIEVWDRFDYSDVRKSGNWDRNPYNPKNNINYTEKETGLAAAYPDHPGQDKQSFFHTVPGLKNNPTLLAVQKRFVDRMLSHSLPYGNVLYCMNNETNTSPAWGRYWIAYIREKAGEANRRVYCTDMWDERDPKGPTHRATYDHPEIYTFIDVSQNNHNKGQAHWVNLQWARQYMAKHPRPMNTVKIYGADTGSYGNDRDGQERFWRNILGGLAATRFHRPTSGLGLGEKAQANIRSMRMLLDEFDVIRATPDAEGKLLSDRAANEAYLTHIEGSQYAVYFPDGGAVGLDLSKAGGEFTLKWLNIAGSTWEASKPVRGGGIIPLAAPGQGAWAVLVTKAR